MSFDKRLMTIGGGALATLLSVAIVGHAPLSWALGFGTAATGVVLYRGNRHAQATVLVAVVLAQTVVSAFGEWFEPWVLASALLSLLTAGVILVQRTPTSVVWLALALSAAQLFWYVGQFQNLMGGVLYSFVLFPFAFRLIALLLELTARRQRKEPVARGQRPAMVA